MLPMNPAVLVDATEKAAGKVPYGWGGKVPLTADLNSLIRIGSDNGIDCSGFVAWGAYYCSNGSVKLTPYSVTIGEELEEFAKSGMVRKVPYSTAGVNDNILRIAGFNHGGNKRHVWFVYNGLSCESSGKRGINRRPWNSKSLSGNVQWCYEVATLSLENEFPISIKFFGKEGELIRKYENCSKFYKDGATVTKTSVIANMLTDFSVSYDEENKVIFFKKK